MNAELMARMSGLKKSSLVDDVAKPLNVGLGDYARKSKDEIIGLIIANATEDQIAEAIDATPAPEQHPAPKQNGGAGESLVEAIRAIAGASVDEQSVRRIVAEAVAELPSKIVEKTIIVRDQITVEIPGGEHVRPELDLVVSLASQGCNVMLVGPSGSGKSFFAEQVAKALGRAFSANSCSAGMSESALSGWLLPVADGGRFVFIAASFVHAYESGGVHLIDEIDAADPNTLVFINQALANGKFYLPQRHENPIVVRHANFVCIAAANTFGSGGDRLYVGREQLDAATLDRFWMVEFGYDATLEEKMVDDAILSWGRELRAKVDALKLRRVVSTRKLIESSRLSKAGVKFDAIKRSFFAPWSTDERAKVGYAA